MESGNRQGVHTHVAVNWNRPLCHLVLTWANPTVRLPCTESLRTHQERVNQALAWSSGTLIPTAKHTTQRIPHDTHTLAQELERTRTPQPQCIRETKIAAVESLPHRHRHSANTFFDPTASRQSTLILRTSLSLSPFTRTSTVAQIVLMRVWWRYVDECENKTTIRYSNEMGGLGSVYIKPFQPIAPQLSKQLTETRIR